MAPSSRTSSLSSSPSTSPPIYPNISSVHSAAYPAAFSGAYPIVSSSGMGRVSPSPSPPPSSSPSLSHPPLSLLLPSSSLPTLNVSPPSGVTPNVSGVAEKDKTVGRRAGKRPAWSAEEDKTLLKFVRCHGPRRFNLLRERGLLSRDGKSCRQRWTAWLRPDRPNQRKSRGRIDLTAEEEIRLRNLQAIMGNKWAQMAPHFPRHTAHEIKNLWHGRVKKKMESEKNDKNKISDGNVDGTCDCTTQEETGKRGKKVNGEEGKTTKGDGTMGGEQMGGEVEGQFSGNSGENSGGNGGGNISEKLSKTGSFSSTGFSVDNSGDGSEGIHGCVRNGENNVIFGVEKMSETSTVNEVKLENGDFMMRGHSFQSGFISCSQKSKSPKNEGLEKVMEDSHFDRREGLQIVPQLNPILSGNEIDNFYASSHNFNSTFSNFSSFEDLDRLASQIKSQMQSFQENIEKSHIPDSNNMDNFDKKCSGDQFNEDQITQNQFANIMMLINCGETPQVLSRPSTISATCTTLENSHNVELESMADVSSFSPFDVDSMAMETLGQPAESFLTMESLFPSSREDCMQKVDPISSYPSQTFLPSAIPSSYLPSHLHNSQSQKLLFSSSQTLSPSLSPSHSPLEPCLSLPPLAPLTPSASFSSLTSLTTPPPSNYLPDDPLKPAGQTSPSTFSTDDIFERLKRLQEAAGVSCTTAPKIMPQIPPENPQKFPPLKSAQVFSHQTPSHAPSPISHQISHQNTKRIPNQKTWQDFPFSSQFSEHESAYVPAQLAPQIPAKVTAGNILATGWRDCGSSAAGRKLPRLTAGRPAANLGLPRGPPLPGFQGMTSYVWRGTDEDWESVLNLWGEEASVVPIVEI